MIIDCDVKPSAFEKYTECITFNISYLYHAYLELRLFNLYAIFKICGYVYDFRIIK